MDRERRATERRIKAAKFPVSKSLESYNFLDMPTLNKKLVVDLARCETAIASNGSMLGIHYRVPGEDAQIVAQHVEPPGFDVPINCLFVSSGDGRAANIVISRGDGSSEVHHG
jgi:hypothetical protein